MSFPTVVGAIQQRPIEQLKMYPQNSRTHSTAQIQQIAASIREFGFVNPILIGTDDVIIAGHARWQAARQLEMAEVPVIVLEHLSEAQRRALTIADNSLAANAGWDEELLRQELAALAEQDFDLNLLGFDDQDLAQLLAAQDEAPELTDPDAVPEPPPLPVSQPGDLWVLGEHRVLCGDATRQEDLAAVLAGATADMVFTDPPYNVAYRGKTKRKLTIQNDALGDEFYDFLHKACAGILAHCAGPVYVCMSSAELHTLYRAFTGAGGHWSTFVIWAKQHFTLGRADYQRQYEPILYGWREGADHYWCGARNQGDVWSIPRPAASWARHLRMRAGWNGWNPRNGPGPAAPCPLPPGCDVLFGSPDQLYAHADLETLCRASEGPDFQRPLLARGTRGWTMAYPWMGRRVTIFRMRMSRVP